MALGGFGRSLVLSCGEVRSDLQLSLVDFGEERPCVAVCFMLAVSL